MEVFDGKDFFNGIISSASASLSQMLAHFFGPKVNAPFWGPINFVDICAAMIPLLAALIINVVLKLIFHQQTDKAPHSRHWRVHLFGGVGGPIYLVIWLGGIYLAIAPLLLKFWTGDVLKDVENVLNEMFTIAVLGAVLWLCLRLTRFIELRLDLWAEKIPGRAAKFIVPLIGRSLRALIGDAGSIVAGLAGLGRSKKALSGDEAVKQVMAQASRQSGELPPILPVL